MERASTERRRPLDRATADDDGAALRAKIADLHAQLTAQT
jgi:hypothetical protein